ncbi:protein LLP homolog [Pectinophora gossypiella]|uniref:Protein LLP homolog n=1 Tax=Pectinophora gossypiella TaxID=13191 RepID=A0A1E1VYJ1_PECGO|nr:protein LLP homolog [Pectinophora gossypiella]
MAKSIRSKWKRKCRAIKRERYAVKELARLKKMLGIKEEDKKPEESEVMESDQVIFLDAGEIAKKNAKKTKKQKIKEAEEQEDVEMSSDDEKIEVDDGDKGKRIYSSKTLKDQNGQYPIWLHKRKIAKMNKVTKKAAKKRSKKRRR